MSKSTIRRALRIAGIAVAILVALILVLSIFRVSIPLEFLRTRVETAASEALGREFRMESAPRLVIGLNPALKLENCSIDNPQGWPGNQPFARLDRFYIKLGLLPLLGKDIRVDKLEISGLQVNLQEHPDGRVNWKFGSRSITSESETAAAESPTPNYRFSELRKLAIKDVSLQLLDAHAEKRLELAFATIDGRAASGENLTLKLTGTLQEKPFEGRIEGESLSELVSGTAIWPYELSASLSGLSVALSGALGPDDQDGADEHDFEIDAPDAEALEPYIGPLPPNRPVRLTGKLRFTSKGFAMPVLTGKLGNAVVNGNLTVDTSEEVPRVKGRLDLGKVDLAAFNGSSATSSDGEAAGPTLEESAQPAAFTVQADASDSEAEPAERRLLPLVGEIRLTIAEIVNPKTEVKNLKMGVKIEQSSVVADVSVDYGEAPLSGELEIRSHDRQQDPVTIELNLAANNADIGKLVAQYSDTIRFTGRSERLLYTIRGAGRELAEAWARKQVILEATKAEVTFHGEEGESTDFEVEQGFVDAAWNRETRMVANGQVHGQAFSFKYKRLKDDKSVAAGRAPFLEFTGTTSGATWRLAGETRRSDEESPLPLELEVSGESLGELHDLLGAPEAVALPYGLKGTILFENGWHLKLSDANLGTTQLTGELARKTAGEAPAAWIARLAIGDVDVREWQALLEEGSKASDDSGLTLDTPLLPTGLKIDAADVDLKIDRLILESGDVSDVMLTATIHDGWVAEAPFRFSLQPFDFTGAMAFDFRNDTPEVGIDLKGESIDVGNILEQMGVAEGLDAKAGQFGLVADARGGTLGEILDGLDLDVRFSNAQWTVADPNSDAKLPITINSGSFAAKRGEGSVIRLDAHAAGSPLNLFIRTDGIDTLILKEAPINLALEGEIAGSTLGLKGTAQRPLDLESLDAQISCRTNQLSDWNKLLNVDLPPIGPLALEARIQMVAEGLALSDLTLRVGETDLTGSLSLNTKAKRPRLKADLSADRFQIDDLAVEGWSPRTGGEAANKSTVKQAAAIKQELAQLLSAKALGALDANIQFTAGDVRLGQETLGSGSLTAKLEAGHLDISPVKVAIPGGEFSAVLRYAPRATNSDWEFAVQTEHFDYGVLARRKDPATDMAGYLQLDVALKSSNVPLEDSLMAHSSGYLNFEICPENMPADIFDFWGTNILFAILPNIDSEQKSKINCILGRMKLENGLMTPEALGIDTTRVRAISEGSIDFKNNTIDLVCVPHPKKPEFLTAGTKLMVTGTFDDFGIEAGKLPILRSLAGMVGSTVLFPGNLLLQERIPEDGSDICSCKSR